MKLVCLSDTHCSLGELINNSLIPDGDILIHAGDLTYDGSVQQMVNQLVLLASLPHLHKIFVCGNHDFLGETHPQLLKDICKNNNITYLQDSGCEIDGVKFWGSPWQPRFFDWAFNLDRGADIRRYWDMIPDNTDVLITHGPPYGIGDACRNGHVGCQDLLDVIRTIKPKVHISGHIHTGYGVADSFGTKFVNASIMNDSYLPINDPIVIEI